MRLYSERQGIIKARTEIQTPWILKNGLWNALLTHYWNTITSNASMQGLPESMRKLILAIWADFFKKSIDTIPERWDEILQFLRYFFYGAYWDQLYSFVEVVANQYPVRGVNDKFAEAINAILEDELSAYRFVGGRITPIT